MIRHALLLFLTALTVCGQPGCAVWTPPVAKMQAVQGEPSEVPVLPAAPPAMSLVPGDVSHVAVGQYAKVWISEADGARPAGGEPRSIAGRILEMNADEIVLSDCVSFEAPVMERRQSPLQKIPFYGRLFKMTGVGVTPTPIPGDVRLVKSSVLGACEIPASEWEWFRQQPHFERIGVDYNFSINR